MNYSVDFVEFQQDRLFIGQTVIKDIRKVFLKDFISPATSIIVAMAHLEQEDRPD